MQLGKPEKEIVMIRSGVDKDAWRARFKSFDRNVCSPPGMCLPMPPRLSCTMRNLQRWGRLLSTYCKPLPKPTFPGAILSLRILGFVNDSQLPGAYKAAVLPSEYDPCPLVIREAMFSGLPVLLSYAVIGRLEMIDPGKSGYPVILIPGEIRMHSRSYSARF
jgi:glycosyltransferase involved in cell wall biosynthesis